MTGNELHVDPVEVLMAADHVDVAGDGLRSDHSSAHERMGVAQGGWIGSSATALAAATAKWEEELAALYAELVSRGEGLRSAAARYTSTDTDAASQIGDAVAHVGSIGL